MAVLSDKTIKRRINELVPNGNADNATHCSYEFTAELMLRGGRPHFLPINKRGTIIKPAQLVWIRASEDISMPPNMVGLWIQTQNLARKGLLLLNISLIEPGYKGPLSAVLVNFGKNPVHIFPNTKIAKVIFLSLDDNATKLVTKRYDSEEYNRDLASIAEIAPKTFLQLQSFEKKADDILETMKREMIQNVKNMADLAKNKIIDDLQSNLRGTLLKWGGLVAAGLLIGCTIVWLMMSSYLPRLSEYAKFDELARRASMSQQASTITGLNTQIQTLATEVKSLKEQMQIDSTNTKYVSDPNNTDPNQ